MWQERWPWRQLKGRWTARHSVKAWSPLAGRVDLGVQMVIAKTTHFSNFALFATPLSGALGSPTGGTYADKATIAAVTQDGALLFTHTGTAWETLNLHVWRLPAGATATAAHYFWLGSLGVRQITPIDLSLIHI